MVNSHHIDALIELKRPKEALEFGKRLLRATRDDDGLVAIAWFCLGQIYYELERYDESISAYKSCLTAACGEDLSINAWYNLASSNAKAGNIDQACNSLIACLATTDEPDAVLLDIPDDEDFKSLDGHPLFEKIISVSDVRDLF